MQAKDPSQLTFGPFRLDPSNRRLYRGVSVIPIRPKTFDVLDYLVARPGRLVTNEQLLAAVWPNTALADSALKVCIREIRDALGDDPETPRSFETAHRLGYRFISQIPQTNLPARLSSFVGRAREIDEIVHVLETTRLLTLVGAGGSGKSRLALEVAGSVGHKFEDGVWWIDLVALGHESFVAQAVADALGVRDQPGQCLTETLSGFLAGRETLLVVDNCEHVIETCAGVVSDMLAAGPKVKVLATSREPLRNDGERIWPVHPLSLPDSGDITLADEALDYEAVRLFAERATAVLPSFEISPINCHAAIEICRRLDGMPLAIELAAARVSALSVEQIAARLNDCFEVLETGDRTELPRHQTLSASIDWSYDLLQESERRLLRCLSVFVDSFTMEAAEQVAEGLASLRDDLFRLIDKALLFVLERKGAERVRFRISETVRQYAYEKLLADEDASAVMRRHREYYLQLAERIEPRIKTADRQTWFAVLEQEHANVRIALDGALRAGNDDQAARLASALFWFWFHGGHWREGRTFLAALLAHQPDLVQWRARALLGDGVLAWLEGDHAAAGARLQESVMAGRALQDLSTAAHALYILALLRLATGEGLGGRSLAQDAVRLARISGDAFCLTIALAVCGLLHLALGEHDAARAVLEESADRARRAGDAWALALPLRHLAIIACRQGDYVTARTLLEETLRGLKAQGEKWFLSRSIETLAEVMVYQGEYQHGARLFGAAETLREAVGASILAFYRADYDRAIEAARAVLGQQKYESCRLEGRTLAPDEAVAHALGEWSLAAD